MCRGKKRSYWNFYEKRKTKEREIEKERQNRQIWLLHGPENQKEKIAKCKWEGKRVSRLTGGRWDQNIQKSISDKLIMELIPQNNSLYDETKVTKSALAYPISNSWTWPWDTWSIKVLTTSIKNLCQLLIHCPIWKPLSRFLKKYFT